MRVPSCNQVMTTQGVQNRSASTGDTHKTTPPPTHIHMQKHRDKHTRTHKRNTRQNKPCHCPKKQLINTQPNNRKQIYVIHPNHKKKQTNKAVIRHLTQPSDIIRLNPKAPRWSSFLLSKQKTNSSCAFSLPSYDQPTRGRRKQMILVWQNQI